ncbi:MAG: ribonuclease activity regulator RraA [Rhodospirillaceae bacterium]|jgi:regulator of RNase E activity RraA|nr:ribonuclease activity regulator RraA [Rhodospirillaceae bacterium]
MTDLSDLTRDRLASVSTATLTTQLFKHGFRNLYLQGVSRLTTAHDRSMVGQAFTLRYIPAREDLDHLGVFQDYDHPQRKAIETCPEGKVLVMDCRGDSSAASAGNILVTRLMTRGAAGLVTDGGLRDTPEIETYDMPTYIGAPSAPTNLIKHHAVPELNQPIGCGGVPVYPDDVIVGDREGVLVIPAHLADQIAEDAARQERQESFILGEIQSGKPLRGTYPPNEETQARIDAWMKDQGA